MNDKQTIKKCDVCNGTGKQWFNIDMISGTEECKYCNGTGEDITTKQTIKERVITLLKEQTFKDYGGMQLKNVIEIKKKDIINLEQELHKSYTNHFIKLIDEEIKKQKSFIIGDINDTNNMITVSLIGHYGILKSKLMEGK